MKSYKYNFLCACMLLCSLSLDAQTRIWSGKDGRGQSHGKQVSSYGLYTGQYDGVHHLVGLHVDGAYATFLTDVSALSQKPLGYGVGLGLDYSYHNGTIIVQTGLGLRWQDVKDSVSIDPLSVSATDAWGWSYRLTYTQTQRRDCARNMYLEVPLMVGSYFGPGFYFIAGPKFSVQLYGQTSVKTLMTTTANYDHYFIGSFGEMDNHGFRKEVPLETKHDRMRMTFDLAVAAELGYEIPLSNKGSLSYRKYYAQDFRIRVAAFAEVGLLDLGQHSSTPHTDIPDATRYDFSTFDFRHVLTSELSSTSSLHNLYAGLRLTFFFYGYQSQERCLQCGVRGAQRKW